jgi:hypothetical protein
MGRLIWQHDGMEPPSSSGSDDGPADTALPAGPSAFVPLVRNDLLGWIPITTPQPGARAACLAVAAHIHLLNPALPLRALDAIAQDAIGALEDGADSVTVIDELHRVDRTHD